MRETKPGQVRPKEGLPMTTPRVSTGTLMGGYIDDVRQFHRRGGCTTNERETWLLSSTCGIVLSGRVLECVLVSAPAFRRGGRETVLMRSRDEIFLWSV